MTAFENISPLGDLELPLVGRVIAAGEVFEVSAEHAKRLKEQPDVWRLVKDNDKKGEV